jgi:hypothetical protein
VAEHHEQDVGPAPGKAEQGLGVAPALRDLPVVVGPGGRLCKGRERGEEESPFELLVPAPGRLFAADRRT